MSTELSDKDPRDYYLYGNIRVSERAYYLVTELGMKLEVAEARAARAEAEAADMMTYLAKIAAGKCCDEYIDCADARNLARRSLASTPLALAVAAVVDAAETLRRTGRGGRNLIDAVDALHCAREQVTP